MLRSRAVAEVTLVVCVFPAALALGAQPRPLPGPLPSYLGLVEEYRRGDQAAAIQKLSSWPRPRLEAQVDAVEAARRAHRVDGLAFPVRAAVMLHTDRSWRDRKETPPDAAAALHRDIAEAWSRLLTVSPEEEAFARRWMLAMCLRAQLGVDWKEAMYWANSGIERFQDDPLLHLASGSILETNASLIQVVGMVGGSGGDDPAVEQNPHEADYVRGLRRLAEATGGRFWTAASPDRLGQAFLSVLESMRTRYVLRFEPRGVARTGVHRLSLRLRRHRGEVHARRAYVVPRDGN